MSMEIVDVPDFNLYSLHIAAHAADRYGVQNRGATAVINGFQMDIDRLTDGRSQNEVDQKQIWRAKKRAREQKQSDCLHESPVNAVYFDRRKDKRLSRDI